MMGGLDHEKFMREAIELSRQGLDSPHRLPFGAVIVIDGKVVGRGSNRSLIDNDPTAHAEVVAIRDACRKAGSYRIDGAVMYTSCEPCPMCLAASLWAGIVTVFYGCSVDDAEAFGFEDKSFYSQICLKREERIIQSVQVLRDEAIQAMRIFKGE